MENEKKNLGQFFTAPLIADFMQKWVLQSSPKNLLDPAVGLGALVNSAASVSGLTVTACELDKELANRFAMAFAPAFTTESAPAFTTNFAPAISSDYSPDYVKVSSDVCISTYGRLNLITGDYLNTFFENKFDAIICNPPYKNFLSIDNRYELIERFEKLYGVRLKKYTNLCSYFLIKSMNELSDGGRLCYIVPYEFLNSGYGVVVKQWLLDSGALKAIIKFDSKLLLFDEAVTTSCILMLEKSPQPQAAVDFISVSSLDEIKSGCFGKSSSYKYEALDAKAKWSGYFPEKEHTIKENSRPNPGQIGSCLVRLSEFGKVYRGLATGGNDYFALDDDMIKALQLPSEVCVPCLVKSRHVNDIIISQKTFDSIRARGKKCFIFDGTRSKDQATLAYIKHGEELGVDKGFLTSHRKIWYSMERRGPAPILITAFNRESIKILRNELMIRALTSFHGLYLKDSDEDFINLLFCYLITPLASELLSLSRREYGNGLDKFEPGDLDNAYILDIRLLSSQDKRKVLDIYNEIRCSQSTESIETLDNLFRKYYTVD